MRSPSQELTERAYRERKGLPDSHQLSLWQLFVAALTFDEGYLRPPVPERAARPLDWHKLLPYFADREGAVAISPSPKICDVIDDTPGETAEEKLYYWNNQPKHRHVIYLEMTRTERIGWESRCRVVTSCLDFIVHEEKRRQKPAVNPIEHREELAREIATRKRAKHAAIRVLEEERAKDLEAFEPHSEEWKRRNAGWARLIEDEMKKG